MLKDGFYKFGYWDEDHENIEEEGLVLIKNKAAYIVKDPNGYLDTILHGGHISSKMAEEIMISVNRNHYAAFWYSEDQNPNLDDDKNKGSSNNDFFGEGMAEDNDQDGPMSKSSSFWDDEFFLNADFIVEENYVLYHNPKHIGVMYQLHDDFVKAPEEVDELNKAIKDFYSPEDLDKNKQYIEWAKKTLPNENWKDFFARNHSKNPDSFTSEIRDALEYFSKSNHIPEINSLRFEPTDSFEDGIKKLKKAEDNVRNRLENSTNIVKPTEETKMMVDNGDGTAWFDLNVPFSNAEGRAMGHCGNAASQQKGEKVLSLRKIHRIGDKTYHEPILTFVNNNGFLGEMKGRVNTKPSKKTHNAIMNLLSLPEIKQVVGGGYNAHMNFNLNDLTPEQRQKVLSKKPNIDPYTSEADPDMPDHLLKEVNFINNIRKEYKDKYGDEWRSKLVEDLPNLTVNRIPILNALPNPTDEELLSIVKNPNSNDILRIHAAISAQKNDEHHGHIAKAYPNLIQYVNSPNIDAMVNAVDSDSAGDILEELSRNSSLNVSRLKKILNHPNSSKETKRRIINHKNSNFEVYKDYIDNGQDIDVIKRIASRENLDPLAHGPLIDFKNESLKSYREEIRKIMAERHDLDLFSQEKLSNDDGSVMGEAFGASVKDALARNPFLHPSLHEKLINSKNQQVRAIMAKRKDLDPKFHEQLADDRLGAPISLSERNDLSPLIQEKLINKNHPGIDSIFVSKSSLDPSFHEKILDNVIKRINSSDEGLDTNFDILEKIANKKNINAINQRKIIDFAKKNRDNDKAIKVADTLSLNPNLDKSMQEHLLGINKYNIYGRLSSRKDLDPSLYEKIIEGSKTDPFLGDYGTHANIAMKPNLSPSVQRKLAQSPDHEVHKILAENPDLDTGTQDILAKTKNEEALLSLAKRSDISVSAQKSIASSNYKNAILELTKNPNLDKSLHKEIALRNDLHPYIKSELAKFEDLDPEVFHLLSNDNNSSSHPNLADNINLPKEIQEKLVNSKNHIVRQNIAFREDLDPRFHEQLVNDKDSFVRKAMAQRKDLDPKFHEQLVNDDELSVRHFMAQREDLDPKFHDKLMDDSSIVRNVIAQKNNLSLSDQKKLARHSDESTRRVLAKNKNLHEDIQKFLARDISPLVRSDLISSIKNPSKEIQNIISESEDPETLISLARHKKLDKSLHRRLLNNANIDVNRAVSSRDDLDPELYERMVDDPDVDIRHYLAKKPDLDLKFQEKLIGDENEEIRQEMAEREDLDPRLHGLLVNDKRNAGIRQIMAERKDLDPKFHEQLVNDQDPEVRLAMAKREDLHPRFHEQLVNDTHSLVRHAIGKRKDLDLSVQNIMLNHVNKNMAMLLASRENLDPRFHEQLVNDSSDEIRQEMAKREDLDPKFHEQLVNDKDLEVRKKMAKRKDLDSKFHEQLVNDEHHEVRAIMSEREDLDPKFHEQLVNDDNSDVRFVMAQRKDLDPKFHEQLVNDKDDEVRSNIAKREDLHPRFHEQLVNDDNSTVRWTMANRKDLNPKFYGQLIDDHNSLVRLQIAAKPNLELKHQEKILNNGSKDDVIHLATNPNLHIFCQKKMIDYDDYDNESVLQRLANRDDLSESIQNKLIGRSTYIDMPLAQNKNLHPKFHEELVNHWSSSIREKMAQREDLDPKFHEQLANDKDKIVRIAMAQRKDLHPKFHEKLVNDDDYEIRSEMAKREDLHPKFHEQLVNDDHWVVRREIAKNPNLQLKHQEKLSNDKIVPVRADLAANPNLDRKYHKKLANEKFELVRNAMKSNPNYVKDMSKSEAFKHDINERENNLFRRAKILNELSLLTDVRIAKSGKKEFLLHRGEETRNPLSQYPTEIHNFINHTSTSSWTPHFHVAFSHATEEDKFNGPRKVHSAWVSEDNIRNASFNHGLNKNEGNLINDVMVEAWHESEIENIFDLPGKINSAFEFIDEIINKSNSEEDFKKKEPKGPLTYRGAKVKANPQIKNRTKCVFDSKRGVLHTPKGSFAINIPTRDKKYKEIINSSDVKGTFNEAMNNWFRLNNILKSGQKLPKEIVAHANLFSILSANTPVPMQELSYSRLMDTFNMLNVDPLDPSMSRAMGKRGEAFRQWKKLDKPNVFPEHAKDYWEGKAKPAIIQTGSSSTTGRKPGDIKAIGSMNEFAKRISKSVPVHYYVSGLINRHGIDGRKIASQMMQDKASSKTPEDHPMKLGAGLGSKTSRYSLAMMGAGNIIVPDTHFIRNIFGLDQNTDSETIDYLKQLLWIPGNHGILSQIDSHFYNNHPAVKSVIDSHFNGEPNEQAIFPAFWLHWLSIPLHEKALGIGTPNQAKNFTDHTPFWQKANEILKEHGLLDLKKSEYQPPIYNKTAPAMLELDHKLGSAAASMIYYAYIVPKILGNEKMSHSSFFNKSKEKIPGGLSSGKNPEDFDQEQLSAGIKVEMEHTNDKDVATEIAMDHLSEDPDYYKKLKNIEKLDKGIKDAVAGAAMLGALASPSMSASDAGNVKLREGLTHIAAIESSSGKNKKHAMTTVGVNAGDTAAGSTGLMPITAKEAIDKDSKLSAKYKHVRNMDHDEMTKYLNENPNVENEIANSHWDRLDEEFNGNKSKMAYAWRKGISAAKNASDEKIEAHPYVKKYHEESSRVPASDKQKKLQKAKKVAEIAKSLVLEKIGQMTHNMQPMSVGHDVFQKDLEAAMGSFAVDTGGIRSLNDKKKEDDRKNSLDQVPPKHKKKFEKAMEESDLQDKVINKIKMLKNRLKR